MGQNSAEAKREVEQTRAHLGETLDALQAKARRNLDIKTQLQTNRPLQVAVGVLILAATGFAVFGYRQRRRRTPAEQLARTLKLGELRDRVSDFRDDAKAWASAQRRIRRADGNAKSAETQSKESITRKLIMSTAQAALTALAAGIARRIVSGSNSQRDGGRGSSSKP